MIKTKILWKLALFLTLTSSFQAQSNSNKHILKLQDPTASRVGRTIHIESHEHPSTIQSIYSGNWLSMEFTRFVSDTGMFDSYYIDQYKALWNLNFRCGGSERSKKCRFLKDDDSQIRLKITFLNRVYILTANGVNQRIKECSCEQSNLGR